MSDPLSGITNISPAYPVKPVQPSKEDRRSGRRRKPLVKDKPAKESNKTRDTAQQGEAAHPSTIDEYI